MKSAPGYVHDGEAEISLAGMLLVADVGEAEAVGLQMGRK
jgi:hypothetical protein